MPANRQDGDVKGVRYSQQELDELADRLNHEQAELAELGIELSEQSREPDGIHVRYFAVDATRAGAVLRDRYGAALIPICLGPSRVEERHPFESYVSEGATLTVFYSLPVAEKPGNCTVQEHEDRVVVTLTILVWQGWRTPVDGFSSSASASVELSRPLGTRIVIDASADVSRPERTEVADPS